jgi:hypothetical protein
MSRRLRLFVVNNDPNMLRYYVQKSTIDFVPPGKVRLHLHVIQVVSPIHTAPRQSLPDFQPTLFNQIDFGPISSIADCIPLMEPSRASSLGIDFSSVFKIRATKSFSQLGYLGHCISNRARWRQIRRN